jgi:hypothetical protein
MLLTKHSAFQNFNTTGEEDPEAGLPDWPATSPVTITPDANDGTKATVSFPAFAYGFPRAGIDYRYLHYTYVLQAANEEPIEVPDVAGNWNSGTNVISFLLTGLTPATQYAFSVAALEPEGG